MVERGRANKGDTQRSPSTPPPPPPPPLLALLHGSSLDGTPLPDPAPPFSLFFPFRVRYASHACERLRRSVAARRRGQDIFQDGIFNALARSVTPGEPGPRDWPVCSALCHEFPAPHWPSRALDLHQHPACHARPTYAVGRRGLRYVLAFARDSARTLHTHQTHATNRARAHARTTHSRTHVRTHARMYVRAAPSARIRDERPASTYSGGYCYLFLRELRAGAHGRFLAAGIVKLLVKNRLLRSTDTSDWIRRYRDFGANCTVQLGGHVAILRLWTLGFGCGHARDFWVPAFDPGRKCRTKAVH